MRTREEIARVLNEISNQLIELTLYDLHGEEEDQISNVNSAIENVIKGYYYEFQTKEELEESEKEAIASGAGLKDFSEALEKMGEYHRSLRGSEEFQDDVYKYISRRISSRKENHESNI